MISSVCGEFIRFEQKERDVPFADTGFTTFTSLAGCAGLAKEDADTRVIEILAVNARNPGKGQLRAFIAQLQRSYEGIVVWRIWDENLKAALARYGFEFKTTDNGDVIGLWVPW